MKKILLLVIQLIVCNHLYSQNALGQKKLFSDSQNSIVNYRALLLKADSAHNNILVQSYRDSIKNCIIDAYIDEYKFTDYRGKIIDIKNIQTPIAILVSASWCKPCMAEITAFNKIVKGYDKQITFIVLFWDDKKGVQKLSRKYDPSIPLIPSLVTNPGDNFSLSIAGFKHIVGYPTLYLINKNRQITSFYQGAITDEQWVLGKNNALELKTVGTKAGVDSANYIRLKTEVADLLVKSK